MEPDFPFGLTEVIPPLSELRGDIVLWLGSLAMGLGSKKSSDIDLIVIGSDSTRMHELTEELLTNPEHFFNSTPGSTNEIRYKDHFFFKGRLVDVQFFTMDMFKQRLSGLSEGLRLREWTEAHESTLITFGLRLLCARPLLNREQYEELTQSIRTTSFREAATRFTRRLYERCIDRLSLLRLRAAPQSLDWRIQFLEARSLLEEGLNAYITLTTGLPIAGAFRLQFLDCTLGPISPVYREALALIMTPPAGPDNLDGYITQCRLFLSETLPQYAPSF